VACHIYQENYRNDIKERTSDGFDKKIKESLNSDLRTSYIISDVLEMANIVEVIQVRNAGTGILIKRTRLLE